MNTKLLPYLRLSMMVLCFSIWSSSVLDGFFTKNLDMSRCARLLVGMALSLFMKSASANVFEYFYVKSAIFISFVD